MCSKTVLQFVAFCCIRCIRSKRHGLLTLWELAQEWLHINLSAKKQNDRCRPCYLQAMSVFVCQILEGNGLCGCPCFGHLETEARTEKRQRCKIFGQVWQRHRSMEGCCKMCAKNKGENRFLLCLKRFQQNRQTDLNLTQNRQSACVLDRGCGFACPILCSARVLEGQ